MLKEIGRCLKHGTINLCITQKGGVMSVIVSFKDVPGFKDAPFSGKPEEIEEVFLKKLEHPMKLISQLNFELEILTKKLEEDKEKVTKENRDDGSISIADSLVIDKPELQEDEHLLGEAPKEGANEDPDDAAHEELGIRTIRMSPKHKEEVIGVAIMYQPMKAHEEAIAKIMEIKGVDYATASNYFKLNLQSDLDAALDQNIKNLEKKHAANVEAMKSEMNTDEGESDEFDPFGRVTQASTTEDDGEADEDEFQL